MSELQDLAALIRANTPLIVVETQDEARVVELFRLGYLSWIEAHLVSLGNLTRLVARLDESSQVSDEAGALAAEAAPAVKH